MTTLTTSCGKSIGRGYRRSVVPSALRTGCYCPRAKHLSVWSSASAARIVAASTLAGVVPAGPHHRDPLHHEYVRNRDDQERVLRGIFQDEERCHDNTYAASLASSVVGDEDEDEHERLSPLSKALTAEQRTQLAVSQKQLRQTYHGTEETRVRRKKPHIPTSTSFSGTSFRDHIESVLSSTSSSAASASSRHAFNYEHMRALATATARARIRL